MNAKSVYRFGFPFFISICCIVHCREASPPKADPPGHPGRYFENLGDKRIFSQYRENIEARSAWTPDQVRQRYPAAFQPGPGYASGTIEFEDPVGAALKRWAGPKWDKDAFMKRVRRDGMAVVSAVEFPNYSQALDRIHEADLPLIFTTDAMLQTIYLSYDNLLMHLEYSLFSPQLEKILDSSLAYAKAHDKGRDYQRDVDEVLTTALLLLRPERSRTGTTPAVNAHLEDIGSLALKQTEVFGGPALIDFSQFKPRGHYTKSPQLTAYFQAMMWLSRADLGFALDPREAGGDEASRVRRKKAALALWDCVVKSGSYPAWREMNHYLEYLVGKGDALDMDGMAKVAEASGIRDVSSALEAFNEVRFDAALAAGGLGSQAILSQAKAADKPEASLSAAVFSFMPQRFALDSYTLGQMCHPNVQEKPMPSTQEIAFVLGDNSALEDLPPLPAGVKNASGVLASQRELYDGMSASGWQGNLYNSWLNFLRQLNGAEANPKAAPAFRTMAWRKKMRNTQLASWAQLRHNTILYAKQSYTSMAMCEFPKAYVEPYPAFYQAVELYAQRGHSVFDGKDAEIMGYFIRLEKIAARLREVAERTAMGKAPTDAQTQWLRQALKVETMSAGCTSITEYNGWFMDLIFDGDRSISDKNDFTIADVHTKPVSDRLGPAQVLHVATGPVQMMVVAVRLDNCTTLFVGPVSSYYEVNMPDLIRLNDEEWRSEVGHHTRLALRPQWAGAFLFP